MGLDLTKLEKVRPHGPQIIARCPACAENGKDSKGEHLCIFPDGRFTCVVYPSLDGIEHRKRIYALVGLDERRTGFRVNQVRQLIQQPIIRDVLGHLGRLNLTLAYRESPSSPKQETVDLNGSEVPVPDVPTSKKDIFSQNELDLLDGVDDESIEQIAEIKRLFNGTVVRVTEQND